MADDKSKTGGRDRDLVAGDQDYEVRYLADRLGVTMDRARAAIQAVGNDREKLEKWLKEN